MKRILFVDDEPLLLQGVRMSLRARRNDWDMHFADSGAHALQLIAEGHFDVLVTDLRMPGVDGTTLVARVRAESPDTIRIVLSGYADEVQSQQLVSLAHRYLSKPCEPTRLEECIDRCLSTHSLIHSEHLRTHLGSIGALPPMPSTFAALQRGLADPTVDARKIAVIIQRDPAVAAKVLQVCNSAFFRLPRRISSIQQAVSYLGLASVRSMVLSAEVFRPGKPLCAGINLSELQRHALNVAGIARSLAAGAPWADDAFLAGLLHDVGLLLLGRQYPKEMQEALDAHAAGMNLSQAEQTFLGVDHATAGAYLLGLWGLPYEVVEAVGGHAAGLGAAKTGFDVVSAVAAAHALLAEIRSQDVPAYEANMPKLGDEFLGRIGVSDSWDVLLDRARFQLSESDATEAL